MQNNKQQLLTELVLKDIYKEIIKLKDKDKIHTCVVYFGETNEPEDREKVNEKVSILDSLKKLKIISSYSIGTEEELIPSPVPGEEGRFEDVLFIKASIKLYPSKVIEYIKQILKEKEELLNKLSKSIANILKTLKYCSKNPDNINEDINKVYIQSSKEITNLLKDKLLHNSKGKYRKPFTDLFLAEKELRNKNSSIDTTIKELSAFLGEIKHQISKIKTFINGKTDVNIDEVLARIEEKGDKGEKNKDDFVITMDKNDNFYYLNKKIEFKGRSTIYFYILEYLCKQDDGFATYEQIERYLVEKTGVASIQDRELRIRKIMNGVIGLFRNTTLDEYKRNKKHIIRTENGRGLHICKK